MFEKIVWKETTGLGVGIAIGRSGSGYQLHITANYSPGGNVKGEFRKNVLPPKGRGF